MCAKPRVLQLFNSFPSLFIRVLNSSNRACERCLIQSSSPVLSSNRHPIASAIPLRITNKLQQNAVILNKTQNFMLELCTINGTLEHLGGSFNVLSVITKCNNVSMLNGGREVFKHEFQPNILSFTV